MERITQILENIRDYCETESKYRMLLIFSTWTIASTILIASHYVCQCFL